MKNIIFFDGVCNFCNASVQFIIKRDPQMIFHFAALQSDAAYEALEPYIDHPGKLTADPDSFILLTNGKIYTKSTAALHVMKKLSFPYALLYGFIIVPKPIRDFFYMWFAKNRYRLFGKKESCMLPSSEERTRFL